MEVVEKAFTSGSCGKGLHQWKLWKRPSPVEVVEKAFTNGSCGKGLHQWKLWKRPSPVEVVTTDGNIELTVTSGKF